ncbi:MAG: 8-oxoguanine deaminase, partial [Acetobacter sp.]
MQQSILLKNALRLVTMDDDRRELENGWIFVEGRKISAIGGSDDPFPDASQVYDMSGHVVMPGMVNTHHHMY